MSDGPTATIYGGVQAYIGARGSMGAAIDLGEI
jgi:hypothetical protein